MGSMPMLVFTLFASSVYLDIFAHAKYLLKIQGEDIGRKKSFSKNTYPEPINQVNFGDYKG